MLDTPGEETAQVGFGVLAGGAQILITPVSSPARVLYESRHSTLPGPTAEGNGSKTSHVVTRRQTLAVP